MSDPATQDPTQEDDIEIIDFSQTTKTKKKGKKKSSKKSKTANAAEEGEEKGDQKECKS